MTWNRRMALSVSKLLTRTLLVSVALVAGAQLFVGGCDTDTPTTPPAPAPTPNRDWAALAATPQPEAAPEQVAPGHATSAAGQSWEASGVTVTIVTDGWGAGTCHALAAGRQCRTFEIENGSTSTITSRLAIFNAPEPGCGPYGPDGATNDPNMFEGPASIGPGETGTVSYCVTLNERKCDRIQVDDSWGPFRVFVVGDVFDFGRPCSLPTPTVPPGPTAVPPPTPTPGPTVTPVP